MFTASRVIFELSVAALMLNTNGALGRAGAFAPLVLNVDSPMSSDAACRPPNSIKECRAGPLNGVS
jgi:hypothetical protein